MFAWKAIYNDDTFLNQINSDGSRNKYTDIERSKLKQFLLYKNGDTDPFFVLHIVRPESQKLIFRLRKTMQLNGAVTREVAIVGWQENVKGNNVQLINFVFEDGHVETLDRFNPNHRLYYPIRFLPEERVE